MSVWAVLFDCDGVIVDSEPALAAISAAVLRGHGWMARAEDFAPYIGMGEDSYIGNVVRQYGGRFSEAIKQEIYAAYVAQATDYVRAFPGGLELIRALAAAQVPRVVASSADAVKVEANLAAVGLREEDFTKVISGDMIERKKPWPDIYLLAAECAGAEPGRCIVVEDATAGIEAGKAAGMYTIGFCSNCSAEQLSAAGADFVSGDFAAIRAEIARRIGRSLD